MILITPSTTDCSDYYYRFYLEEDANYSKRFTIYDDSWRYKQWKVYVRSLILNLSGIEGIHAPKLRNSY